MGGGVRMSETRIALRRSSDEDSRFHSDAIKNILPSFRFLPCDSYIFLVRGFNLSLELIHYYWIVLIVLLQAETKVFMID